MCLPETHDNGKGKVHITNACPEDELIKNIPGRALYSPSAAIPTMIGFSMIGA